MSKPAESLILLKFPLTALRQASSSTSRKYQSTQTPDCYSSTARPDNSSHLLTLLDDSAIYEITRRLHPTERVSFTRTCKRIARAATDDSGQVLFYTNGTEEHSLWADALLFDLDPSLKKIYESYAKFFASRGIGFHTSGPGWWDEIEKMGYWNKHVCIDIRRSMLDRGVRWTFNLQEGFRAAFEVKASKWTEDQARGEAEIRRETSDVDTRSAWELVGQSMAPQAPPQFDRLRQQQDCDPFAEGFCEISLWESN